MPEVSVKPYIPVQEDQPELPYYLPTDLNYSLPTEYASLTPSNQAIAPEQPNVTIPTEQDNYWVKQEQPNIALPANQDYWTQVVAPLQQQFEGYLPKPVKKLLGVGGEERYQTWPERTVRSAFTLPAQMYSGEVPMGSDEEIQRAQDIAGVAGGTMFAGVKPGVASLGAGPVKGGISIKPFVEGAGLLDQK